MTRSPWQDKATLCKAHKDVAVATLPAEPDKPVTAPGLPHSMGHANGWSMDGLGCVKKRGPSSVMYMQSSRRTPNSP